MVTYAALLTCSAGVYAEDQGKCLLQDWPTRRKCIPSPVEAPRYGGRFMGFSVGEGFHYSVMLPWLNMLNQHWAPMKRGINRTECSALAYQHRVMEVCQNVNDKFNRVLAEDRVNRLVWTTNRYCPLQRCSDVILHLRALKTETARGPYVEMSTWATPTVH